MASDQVLTIDETNFEAVVTHSDSPVLVDFWAPWCGPCHAVAPTVERIAARYVGQLRVGKINVDDNGGLAGRFGIMSIPTIALFQGGELVDQVVGAVPEARLAELIERHLTAGAGR
jgi:thioredoxin 1